MPHKILLMIQVIAIFACTIGSAGSIEMSDPVQALPAIREIQNRLKRREDAIRTFGVKATHHINERSSYTGKYFSRTVVERFEVTLPTDSGRAPKLS